MQRPRGDSICGLQAQVEPRFPQHEHRSASESLIKFQTTTLESQSDPIFCLVGRHFAQRAVHLEDGVSALRLRGMKVRISVTGHIEILTDYLNDIVQLKRPPARRSGVID